MILYTVLDDPLGRGREVSRVTQVGTNGFAALFQEGTEHEYVDIIPYGSVRTIRVWKGDKDNSNGLADKVISMLRGAPLPITDEGDSVDYHANLGDRDASDGGRFSHPRQSGRVEVPADGAER